MKCDLNQLFETNPEHRLEYGCVRATENAALNAVHWLGCGDKESADAAACEAIRTTFNETDCCGEVISGEGIKDNAPGIFNGERLGTWKTNSPRFDIALDPIDGTTNLAHGKANSISAIGAAYVLPGISARILALPSYYCQKIAFGREIAQRIANREQPKNWLDQTLKETLASAASILGKPMSELVVLVLDKPRNETLIDQIRRVGARLRTISDGDIAGAISAGLPDAGIDLYVGIGGTPEGILAATALRALGGNILMRMWFRNAAEKEMLRGSLSESELMRIYWAEDIVPDNAVFCATGISDGPLLQGVKLVGRKASTHSVLMCARNHTIRYIQAIHDLESRSVQLVSRLNSVDHELSRR